MSGILPNFVSLKFWSSFFKSSVGTARQPTRCLFSRNCLTGLGEWGLAEPDDQRLAELGEHRLA